MQESSTGEEWEKSRDSDQYFFKRYFWDNPDKIAMDYNQSIFGNFLEIVDVRRFTSQAHATFLHAILQIQRTSCIQ